MAERCDSTTEDRRVGFAPSRRGERSFSLLMVMFFIGVGFLVMTGVLEYSGASSKVNERYNEYYTTLSAAEAATEGVIAKMARDFQSGGSGTVDGSLANYRAMVPTAAEVGEWANYTFANASGGDGQTYVEKVVDWGYTANNLNWKYSGFAGNAATYRIISNTRNTLAGNNIVAAVKQDIQLAEIPLFEFGVFYALEMEFHPAQNMTLTGRIHCNTNIYSAPSNPIAVTFAGDVTSAREIRREANPDDPLTRTPPYAVNFLGAQDWNTGSLNLPIGTSNAPSQLHKIIEIPPSPDETTLLGKQRYYNKADLIIIVMANGTLVASSGVSNGLLPVTNSVITNFVFVSTNTFHDVRESRDILFTEINVGTFVTKRADVKTALGGVEPNIIYIADLRSFAGVRLINGQIIPDAGLTIATQNPLYVKGHYNAADLTPGSTDTSATKPASLIADAITVLSGNWQDSNSTLGIGTRGAANTTINAAIVAGIVPSNGTDYSGGLENFIRLLEGWGGFTLTFNGSIVALYNSQFATGPWQGGNGTYTPPIRRYGFDQNFKNLVKLPPGTPYLRTLFRGEWKITQANSTL
jgi:hypothetical protein